MWLVGMVNTAQMLDAKTCPDPVPAGFDAALVYAGGSSAAHAWDSPERERVATLHNLPAWVPTPATDNPYDVAEQFLGWLESDGYTPVVLGTGAAQALMIDMETAGQADARWLDRFCGVTARVGYVNLVYGSAGTLFGLPARDGYIVADPTGEPHMYLHPQAVGTQFAWNIQTPGGAIDMSALDRDLLRHLRKLAR